MILACGESESPGVDDETSGDASSSSTSTSSSSTSPSSSGASETTSDAESSESGAPPVACGALRDVTLFQTIGIPLVEDCEEVAAQTAPIVVGRLAMARLGVEVDTQLAGTEIAARVDLESASGDESFTGACTLADAGAIDLHVEIPATAVHADARYTASVVDCAGATVDSFPTSGTAELETAETGIIRLHLVPFDVGGFVPDTSQAVQDGYRDALLAYYPITGVEITVGADVPVDVGEGLDMGALLIQLIEIQDQAVFGSGNDPAIYYYGMVTGAATRDEFCDSCPTGTSEAGLGDRAGAALGAAFADDLAESTLVHEMGHMHGLLHSPCGDPDDADPMFPYDDGLTHTEGWDFRTGELVPADHNDLMGYCQPRWVSDYNYRKLVDWVQLANGWRNGSTARRLTQPGSSYSRTRSQCWSR